MSREGETLIPLAMVAASVGLNEHAVPSTGGLRLVTNRHDCIHSHSLPRLIDVSELGARKAALKAEAQPASNGTPA